MRNSAELRCFSSPHPYLFSEFLVQFLDLNEKEMETRAYIGWETPVARGGATGPLPLARDLFANSKKNYIRVPSPVAWATDPCRPPYGDRGVFLKFVKTDIYF